MSKFDEMREDLRLARLNNGSVRFLFMVISVFKGLFTLGVLGCFAFGIWYLTYGFDNQPQAVKSASSNSLLTTAAVEVAAKGATPLNTAGELPMAEALSPERIALLKQFASDNRNDALEITADSETDLTASTVGATAVENAVVGLPAATATASTGNDTAYLSQDNIALDNSVRSVFDDLEKKLSTENEPVPPLALAQENTVPEVLVPPSVSPAEQSSVSTDNLQEEASQIVAEPEVVSPTLATNPAGNEIQDAQWALAQNADDYLIQIGSTTNRPFLLQFEQQLPGNQPTAIFEMLIGAQPEHVLVYGLFSDREDAVAELGKLSQSARKYGAYVRKLSAVQRQILDLGGDLADARQVVN